MTEQDVINEEMYEEEDDDLPLQYRRLTAHLQTGSVDFNRRLAAYLTNQVAMRSAMEQMMQNSYGQAYPNAPQFASNNMFPSPLSPTSNISTSSPNMSYRHAPYSNPHRPNFQQNHGRAYSTAAAITTDQQHQSPSTPSVPSHSMDQRRMSTPANTSTSNHISQSSAIPDQDYHRQTQSATAASFPPLWQDMGPFTTQLPPEAQQMMAPALDPNDPFTQSLMQGSDFYTNSTYYPWGQQQYGKPDQMFMNPYAGMSTTLAPSALDVTANESLIQTSTKQTKSADKGKASTLIKQESLAAPSSGLDFNLSQDSKTLPGYPTGMTRENSAVDGGTLSRTESHDGFWDNFVHDEGIEWTAVDGSAED